MNELVYRLRNSAEPLGKLLLEAADALEELQNRTGELTETLRALIEIGNSQRSREFSDVKKTLLRARTLLANAPAIAGAGGIAEPLETQPASVEMPPAIQAEPPNPRDQEIVTGMYNEIQSLLRYSA